MNKGGSSALISLGLGALALVTPYLVFTRHGRNHEAAFCQVLWEIWENPQRDRSIPLERQPRFAELQDYLYNRGFWHVVIYNPPFGAKERFRNVVMEEYEAHCLALAKEKFERVKLLSEERQ